ncbi:AraC-like ligand binding domain-containing protein [Hespellia stercorisuis DSM 15480]|uniref:AraC-like ligand binding domain-containing protein n=1 Tax=Hespellia stercorisuis DSM 15480 TaxID=1121950 RepID=A0A1M6HRW8_9FIRM|nr:AraC family ligand binding domain-containing protein [Hespellia stercorisuis]SHJ24960.1 AraC-like ligand binding domain-containing protein [Hespellia stercorisuis DSM 15480]
MAYEGIILADELKIEEIFSIHYFEYMNNFSFEGETHDFWEFICVDKGEVNIQAGEKHLTLTKGNIAFHKPNQFHNVTTNGTSAPNLVVISFRCTAPCMKHFEDRVLQMSEVDRTLIAKTLTRPSAVSLLRLITLTPRSSSWWRSLISAPSS